MNSPLWPKFPETSFICRNRISRSDGFEFNQPRQPETISAEMCCLYRKTSRVCNVSLRRRSVRTCEVPAFNVEPLPAPPKHVPYALNYIRRVKAYVVRAEDARLLGDMPLMRKMYAELHSLNRRLVGEYAKRANNHRVRGACLSFFWFLLILRRIGQNI